VDCCLDMTLLCTQLQISHLLTASSFQRYSGPVLESLTMQEWGYSGFDFAAPPEIYPVSCISRAAPSGMQAAFGCRACLQRFESAIASHPTPSL
jgi:hypothetical protein